MFNHVVLVTRLHSAPQSVDAAASLPQAMGPILDHPGTPLGTPKISVNIGRQKQ